MSVALIAANAQRIAVRWIACYSVPVWPLGLVEITEVYEAGGLIRQGA